MFARGGKKSQKGMAYSRREVLNKEQTIKLRTVRNQREDKTKNIERKGDIPPRGGGKEKS